MFSPEPRGLLERRARDLDRILRAVVRRGPDREVELAPEDAQLFDRRGALQVGGDEEHTEALALEHPRELAGGRRLPGALQTGEHHHGRRFRTHLELAGHSTERLDELFVHDLDDLLARAQALLHVRAVRPFLDAGDELLHDLDVDVGLEQRQPDLAGDLVDVLLAQPAAAAQAREDAVKTVGEGVEHVPRY